MCLLPTPLLLSLPLPPCSPLIPHTARRAQFRRDSGQWQALDDHAECTLCELLLWALLPRRLPPSEPRQPAHPLMAAACTGCCPQCPLTRELESAFDRIARQLHPEVCVGKIDGSVERGLLSRFQVRPQRGWAERSRAVRLAAAQASVDVPVADHGCLTPAAAPAAAQPARCVPHQRHRDAAILRWAQLRGRAAVHQAGVPRARQLRG